MKFVFILLFCLCVTRLFCQNDSSKLDFSAYSYNGIAVLKKADIIRLAGSDFMQLIQAAFPFTSSSTIEEDYSFLVNGFILTNPNSVNVSQIENVRFYPAGTILSPGNMTKNGTFVIETRPEETGFSLSTKTGAVVPRKDEMPSISKSGKGFLTSSELTYQQQKQNFFISNSVSWLHNKFPDYADVSAYSISKNKGNWNRLRISNFAGYQISRSWTIEGGAFFTSQPQNTKGNIEYLPPLFLKNTSTSSEKKPKYAGANGALIFSPVISVKNILSAETVFSKQQTEAQSYTTYNTGQFVSSIRTYNGKFKEYSFTEHFMWNPVNLSKVKLQVSALIRYYLQRTDENSHLSLIEAGSVNNDSIYQKIRSKNLLVSPSVGIRIKEIISAQIGLTYDDYSNYRYGDNKKKKVLPNASLKLDMSSYLNNSIVKSLVIYSSYYQNLNNYENMDKLDRDLYSYTPPRYGW